MQYNIQHSHRLFTCKKVYSQDDVVSWVEKISRTDEEKFRIYPIYEGLKCHYDNGKYITFGDGISGTDITDVCSVICTNHNSSNDFTGDIVISKDDFEVYYRGRNHQIKHENNKTFTSPYNAVTSIFHADDINFYMNQKVRVSLVNEKEHCEVITKSGLQECFCKMTRNISLLPYDVLGVELEVLDEDYAKELGYDRMYDNSRMMLSLKENIRHCIIRNVEYGVSHERITAYADVEPFVYDSKEINRVIIPVVSEKCSSIVNNNIYNCMEIAVDVSNADSIHMWDSDARNDDGICYSLTECPFCGSDIDIQKTGVKCKNDNCRKVHVSRIFECMNALGMRITESDVDKVYQDGDTALSWIQNAIKGDYGDSLKDAASSAANTTISAFVSSLGITGVGTKIGTAIEIKYGDVYDFLYEKNIANLKRIKGVGDSIAERIFSWLEKNRDYAIDYANVFSFANPKIKEKKKVCFDNIIIGYNRLSEITLRNGYEISSSINKDVDILVIHDNCSVETLKQKKAKEFGTRILTLEEYAGMLDMD